MSSSGNSSSSVSQRRQMLQPWPVCLMFTSKSKEKGLIGAKQYERVPTSIGRVGTTSSNFVSDCASNATLVTNASPFNSQLTLTVDGTNSTTNSRTKTSPKGSVITNDRHYYAENLKNQNRSLVGTDRKIYDVRTEPRYEDSYRSAEIVGPSRRSSEGERDEEDYEFEDEADLRYKQFDRLILERDSDILMGSQEFQPEMTRKASYEKTYQFQKETRDVPSRYYLTQILAALSVSVGSMVVGFSSSYTSPALVTMKREASLMMTDEKESWIAGVMPLSALFGGVVGGPLIEYLGRRNTILATGAPFTIAWLLIAFATSSDMILGGRALSGFCVGIASLSLPVYLGETLQPEVRGTLGLLPTAFGNIGILLCFVAGMYLDWSQLAVFGACIPIPFVILMFLIPETPRWYISKGKTEKARKSLQWLRGKRTDVSSELSATEKTHVESERNASKGAFRELLKRSYAKPLLISLGLMFFQQMSGINAVIFFTVKIFQSAGSTIDENVSTIIVGVVNFLSTFAATVLIDRLGRKILLYASAVAMILSLVALGTFFYLIDINVDTKPIGWLPLASFIVYIIGFSLGFGPIPWLMMGEILPAKIRGSAASIVTAFNWFCTFVVTKSFNDVIGAIGNCGTFWMFSVIVLAGLIFVIIFVPETRGRSLEEIEMRLTGPVRRMSAVANIKPLPTAC